MGAALLWGSVAAAQAPELEALEQAARADRQNADAQQVYGLALLRAGKHRDAQRALQAAQRLDRDNPARIYDVARVAFARGEYRPASAACRPLRRVEGSSLGKVCEARAFLVWNRAARAFELLEEVLAVDASDFEALLALGDAHRLRAAVSEAEDAYRRAASAEPDSALPHLGLGRLYAAANRDADAITALRTADTKSKLESGVARPASGHPEIAFELGHLLEGAESIAMLERAVAGRPDWAEAQVALGRALLATGNTAGAKTAFEGALRASRNYADAYVGLGNVLLTEGAHDDATRQFERALSLVQNHPAAVLGQARIAEAKGDNEEAFTIYRRAADLTPAPDALIAAADLALRLRRDVLAVGFLDRVIQRLPTHARALELYGDAMVARSDRDGARGYYLRALEAGAGEARARIQGKLAGLGRPRAR